MNALSLQNPQHKVRAILQVSADALRVVAEEGQVCILYLEVNLKIANDKCTEEVTFVS